jgi:hypothetical protein
LEDKELERFGSLLKLGLFCIKRFYFLTQIARIALKLDYKSKNQIAKSKNAESQLRCDGIFLDVEWAGAFFVIILLFELPMLTFCQTTSVFYQNLTGCKGKNVVFSEKKHI